MGWFTDPKKAAYNRVYNRTTRGCLISFVWMIAIPVLLLLTAQLTNSCSGTSGKKGSGGTYVKPSVDKNGHLRKGYVRMPVSTKKNAIANQNRSRYYYQTRGKYHKKK